MNYELTIFKNQFDNKTHKRVSLDSWEKFVELLRGLSLQKGQKGGNNSSVLITPAVFENGTTRANRNTLYWGGWCCVDVDDHLYPTGSADVSVAVLDALKEALRKDFGQYDYVVYNTASSRVEMPKFRIVFRLDETVENERIKSFWYALNTELGDIGDPQTKDLARMYYVPAQYPDAWSFFFENKGRAMNVSELIAKHPYHEKIGNSFFDGLPLAMQQAMIQHRKNSLNNTDYKWTGYRDCPFFPKRIAIEYQSISETGWYRKMYQIMVATAGNAYYRGYPLTATQIEELCREFDRDNGNWYENRPMALEAATALEYIYKKG